MKRITLTSVAFGLAALFGCLSAYAADEIIVTATKRASLAVEIPASINVISGAAAEKSNRFNSANEITQLLPGVQAALANGAQAAFQIRGVGAVDHQALTPGASAVYSDGVFLATNVQTSGLLYDIERIEVLKGPQGSLYGRNASSGAINFITRRPGPDQDGYFAASYGRFDRVDLAGAIGGQLAENVHARLAGRFLRQDPTLENVDANANAPSGPAIAGGKRDEFGLRGSLAWTGGATELLARAHYEEDNGVNPAPRNSALDLDDHQIAVGPDGVQETDNEFFGASLELRRPLGDWSLYSLSAIEGYNQQYGFDFDGAEAPFGDPTLNANLAYDRDFLQVSNETRVERDWRLGRIMVGVAAAREDFEQEYLIWCGTLNEQTLLGTCRYVGAPGRVGPTPASPGTATTLITEIEQNRITAAPFFHGDMKLHDRVTLIFGARYTFERIVGEGSGRHIFDDGTIAFNNRGGVGPAIGENKIIENRLSGDVALQYRLEERSFIYASFANGYKSGGFNGEVQNNATHFQDEGLFAAETVNAFELGYKGRPASDIALNIAGFYLDYQRPQARIFVNFPLPDGTSIVSNSLSNLDEARVFGLEAETRWSPDANTELGVAAAWLDSKIRQTSDEIGNAALFDGNPLPFASEVSATAFVRKDWRVSDEALLTFFSNAKFRSDYYLDAEGLEERKQNGFVTWDGEIALQLDKAEIEVALWARNILNKDYAVSGFGFIGYNVFLGDPRTYGVRATKRF